MSIFSKFIRLASLSSFLVFFGCDGGGGCHRCVSEGENLLRVNLREEPQCLDPRRARELNAQSLMRMFFEGLTRLNQQDTAELALAKSVEVSDDLKTYTFYLKHTQWTNGDPVTAYDFEYAWKKVLSPSFPSDLAFNLYVIKNAHAVKQGKCPIEEVGIKVLSPMALQVELENPTPYFLDLLAFPVFFPVNQRVDKENPNWHISAESYVSNGPFLLKKWEHENFIEAKKNSKYWDANNVQLSRVYLTMVQEDTEYRMYEKKELDWAGSPFSSLPLDSLPRLKQDNILKSKPILQTRFIRTNTEHPLLCSQKVRQALALGINRKSIAEHVIHGNFLPATGLLPPALSFQAEPYFIDGDVAHAKELFNEALVELGLDREHLPKITLLYAAGDVQKAVAQIVVEQWRDSLGIEVNLESVERKVFFSRISKRDFDLAPADWIADFNDPINFLEVFKYKTGSNNTNWESKEYAHLLDESNATGSKETRRALMHEAEKYLINEMPIIPLFYTNMLYTNNERIENVVLSPLGGVDFKWVTVR